MQFFLKYYRHQLSIWLLLVCTNLSLTPSSFCTKLNEEQNAISVQFQMQNGSNRIAETKQLLSLVISDANAQHPIPNTQYPIPNTQYPIPNTQYPIPNTQYPIPNYSIADLKKIFGNPSIDNEDGSLTYIYDYTNNKSFTINYNKQNQKTELTIYN